jgi:carboxymethylenebutenolidase
MAATGRSVLPTPMRRRRVLSWRIAIMCCSCGISRRRTITRSSANEVSPNFQAWEHALDDAISWTAQRQSVDPARLALLGVSLGAALALAHAALDLRCEAVVDFYGILPPLLLVQLRRLPPTMILHGARDWVVPVAAAYQLATFLQARRIPYDMHIYPEEGHGFRGAAASDAMARTIRFLDQHVSGTPPDGR